MQIKFWKFDGAGNDFVLIDAREHDPQLTPEQIAHFCHRRFGVGADGLMTLHSGDANCDFEMRYYNSDGYPAEMCGNGGRCIVVFAHLLGVACESRHLRFNAADGMHEADITQWNGTKGVVRLGMRDVPVSEVCQVLGGTLLNTGVPHLVKEVRALDHMDVRSEGRRLRFDAALGPAGANVNFVEPDAEGVLHVRTYERGVEDETWACGTGVTACAMVTGYHRLKTLGGDFCVDYQSPTPNSPYYTQVVLQGPVSLNFIGSLSLEE